VTLGVPTFQRRRTAVAAAVTVLVIAVASAWVLSRTGAEDEARSGSRNPTTTLVAATAPSSTMEALPTSNLAGIQPGVEVVEGVEDRTPGLEQALDDELLVFQSLAPWSSEVVPVAYYGKILSELPARIRYQGFNAASPEHCRGMMTHQLQLEGLWERGAAWPGGRMQIAVGRLRSEQEAHELFTALSLAVGVKRSGCDGMGGFGPASFDEHYQVVQRDILLHDFLVPSVTYNTWVMADAPFGDVTYRRQLRVVVEQGTDVLDLALLDDGTVPQEQTAGSIVMQVLARL
jgi:hypothetical protein